MNHNNTHGISEASREKLIEKIIEINYYLTGAIIEKNYTKIQKYKGQLDALVAFMLEEKIE
jgi:hypothetical protein